MGALFQQPASATPVTAWTKATPATKRTCAAIFFAWIGKMAKCCGIKKSSQAARGSLRERLHRPARLRFEHTGRGRKAGLRALRQDRRVCLRPRGQGAMAGRRRQQIRSMGLRHEPRALQGHGHRPRFSASRPSCATGGELASGNTHPGRYAMKKWPLLQISRKPVRTRLLALEQLESRVLPSVSLTTFRNASLDPGVNQDEVQLTPATSSPAALADSIQFRSMARSMPNPSSRRAWS
jgi:hypothetical protein